MGYTAGDGSSVLRICFVCSGNICRSAMAEAVLRRLVADAGVADRVVVTSAGTGDWHVGERADPRTIAVLTARGYDGSRHRARRFEAEWFPELDLVIAADRGHERELRAWAGETHRHKVRLLRSFDPDGSGTMDVPDPYYADAARFDDVLVMVERACTGLFRQLEPAIRGVP